MGFARTSSLSITYVNRQQRSANADVSVGASSVMPLWHGLHAGPSSKFHSFALQQTHYQRLAAQGPKKSHITAVLDGTALFRQHSKCPFAPKATAFPHQQVWDTTLSIPENMMGYNAALQAYVEHIKHCQRTQKKCHDFFSIEAPAALYGQDHVAFQQWIYDVLFCIQPEAMTTLQQTIPNSKGYYTDTDWRFIVHDIRFFILTSSGLYEQTSSRYAGGGAAQKQVLLHLQPAQSFDWWLPKHSAQRQQVKQAIRQLFAKANRSYDHLHHTPEQEPLHHAMKFVFPLVDEDQQTPWWKQIQAK